MAKKLKKLLKKAGKAALIGGALYGATKLGKLKRNKAIDMGIAAADEEPGALIKDFGPYRPSPRLSPYRFDKDHLVTPTLAAKGGRIGKRGTGIAKRGFGRALKGK